MKENEETVQSAWHSMISLLKSANDAGTWAFWRERLKCTHPQHNTSEIDNPTRYAEVSFHVAKQIYCKYKDELDKFEYEIINGIIPAYPGISKDCQFFNAMKRVVEEEMASQLEEQILNADEPEGYWEGDEYLPLPDSEIELANDSY